ncbi:glycosyltransferase, partial [Streptomyces sp. UMAF16]|nr:glycosyltransferase [Streptomyces sp. UMAF16]
SSIPPLVLTGVTKKAFSEFRLMEFKNNNLIFLDYVSEELLPLFYANADLIVNTSRYEGFGIPILDALTT